MHVAEKHTAEGLVPILPRKSWTRTLRYQDVHLIHVDIFLVSDYLSLEAADLISQWGPFDDNSLEMSF